MQFEINKTVLIKLLSNISGVVDRKNSLPILFNVKIEARAGKLCFTTTNMDLLIAANIENQNITEEGETTIPVQLFHDIVKKIPDNVAIKIKLQEKDNIVSVTYGKSKFTLPCLDPIEFPILSDGEPLNSFTIESKEFARLIDKSRFAVSNDDTRFYLNGIFLHSVINENNEIELRSVATDGHRLALSSLKSSEVTEDMPGVIIPKKTVNEIRKIIDNEENLKISLLNNKIRIKSGDYTIISKLIDGQFPEYNQIIPKNNDKVITIDKKIIFDAVDRVSTIANDQHRTVKCTLETDKISLQVNSSDGGFADEEVSASFKGNKIEVGFNSKYLLEIISQIDSSSINLKFDDSFSPIILNSDNLQGLYVIMPVKI